MHQVHQSDRRTESACNFTEEVPVEPTQREVNFRPMECAAEAKRLWIPEVLLLLHVIVVSIIRDDGIPRITNMLSLLLLPTPDQIFEISILIAIS